MVAAYANDNWSQPDLQPGRDDISLDLSAVTMDVFVSNVERFAQNIDVSVIPGDSSNLSVDDFDHKVNIIFYDGDNNEDKMNEFFSKIDSYTDDVFTLIIDDANIQSNVEVTKNFINATGWKILYERELLNDFEDSSMWWNGLYVVVLSK